MTQITDGRSLRAEAKRQARRAEILRAAARLFGKNGYHATSVSNVIEAAGISRGTFYLYFDGKDTLFLDLMDQFTARITQVISVVDATGPQPTREIYDNVRRVVDVVLDNSDLAAMVLREDLGINPDVDERLHKLYGFLHEMVEGALVNGACEGLTRKVNEDVVATALIGGIKEVFYRHLVTPREGAPDREVIARSLYEFALEGLLVARQEPS